MSIKAFVAEEAKRRQRTKIERERHGNEEIITSTSATIRTIEDLLDACGICRTALDRNGTGPWLVERWTANKWDQAAQAGGGRSVLELWQVKAVIRRRIAVPVEFQPVAPLDVILKMKPCDTCAPKPKRTARRALIIPDSQNGFSRSQRGDLEPLHDRGAWDVAIQIAGAAKPDVVVLLGDMLDLPDWSDKFVHGPEFFFTTQPSLVELYWWFARLRQVVGKNCVIHYLSGNHEERLVRAQRKNLVAATGLKPVLELESDAPILSIPRLLNLDSLDINFIEDYPGGQIWLNSNLRVSHGHIHRSEGGDTAKAILRDARASEIYGHVHRIELIMKTTHPMKGPTSYVAFSPGTLARVDGIVPSATPRVNWQQGVGVVDFEPDGDARFHINPVPIFDGRAIWCGNIYESRFDIDRLRSETSWSF